MLIARALAVQSQATGSELAARIQLYKAADRVYPYRSWWLAFLFIYLFLALSDFILRDVYVLYGSEKSPLYIG